MEKGGRSTGKLTRQRSRLQMHAPSSIEVVPTTTSASMVAEWKVAIPLLSPLDIVSYRDKETPQPKDTRQPSVIEREEQERRAIKWSTWQDAVALAGPQPVNRDGPVFLLPTNCV